MQIQCKTGNRQTKAPLHPSNFSRRSSRVGSHVSSCTLAQSCGREIQKQSAINIQFGISRLDAPVDTSPNIGRANSSGEELKVLTQKWRINGTGENRVLNPSFEIAADIQSDYLPLCISQVHWKKVCGMSTVVGRTGARQCAFTTERWKGRAGRQGAFGGKRQKEGEREFEDECFMGLCHAAKNIPPNSECMGY